MADYKVLLIDYEPKSIERIVRPLESIGFSVEVATDGLSGMEAFERLKPHLVIIEAMIPKKHGFEVCQELKKTSRGKRTPIVITTAVYKGRKYRHQGLHIYGCDEYVEKPIPENVLIELARRLVGDTSPEPVAVGVTRETQATVSREAASSVPAPMVAAASATTSSKPRSQPTAVSAIVGDLTEQEIMDRLDALLPTDPFEGDDESLSNVISSLSKSPADAAEAAPETAPSLEPEELSALDRAFQFSEEPSQDSQPDAAAAEEEAGAQVVSFEPARTRRSKRSARREEPVAAAVEEIETPPAPAKAAPAASVAAPAPKVDRIVSTPLPPAAPKSGFPMWALGIVGVAALAAGAYFLFFRGTPETATPVDRPAQVQTETGEPLGASTAEPTAGSTDAVAEPPAPQAEPPKVEAAPPVPAGDAPAKAAVPAPARGADARRAVTKGAAPAAAAAIEESRPVLTTTSSPAATPSAPPVETEKKPAEAESKPAESQAAPSAAPDTKDPPPEAQTIESPEEPPPSQVQSKLSASDPNAKPILAQQVDAPAVAVSRPLPPYTAQARLLRQEGKVVIRVLVDETGRVADAQLVSGIAGSDLNAAVLRTAKNWVYRPARKQGVPVKGWKTEEVVFKR